MISDHPPVTPQGTVERNPSWVAEFPLSVNQERVCLSRELARRLGKQPPPDLIFVCLTLSGHLDVPALKRAFREVVRRHAALRTLTLRAPALSDADWDRALGDFARTGVAPQGLYVQQLASEAEIEFYDHNLCDRQEDQAEALRTIFESEASTPLDEQKPLGLRVNLIRQNQTRHLLLVAMDHRVSDAWSAGLLRREIECLYAHFADGAPAPASPRTSYPEFGAWQNQAFESEYFSRDLAYWEDHWRHFGSARIGARDLPFTRSTPQKQSGNDFATELAILDSSTVASLRAAARRSRVTLYVLFLAAFVTVLRHYTGKTKTALWCHCANRTTRERTEAIGFFVNTHLMGFDLTEDVAFRDLVADVATRQLETLRHQEMPLQHLWRTLNCVPRFGDSGIMLDYYAEPLILDPPATGGSVTFMRGPFYGPTAPRMASIGVYVIDKGRELSIRSDYVAALYPSEAVVNMLEDLKDVALAFVANPDVRISNFPEIAGRYLDRPKIPRTDMSEFILLGSERIPTRGSLPLATLPASTRRT